MHTRHTKLIWIKTIFLTEAMDEYNQWTLINYPVSIKSKECVIHFNQHYNALLYKINIKRFVLVSIVYNNKVTAIGICIDM